ncbi:MAG: amidohydrolase family protein [Planctomycetes bacterium]|nr:amidohydrolase family protein [Planctomycetota bacterium]
MNPHRPCARLAVLCWLPLVVAPSAAAQFTPPGRPAAAVDDVCCGGGHHAAGPLVEPPPAAPTDWDITAPFGPTRDVDIDTDEGTWIQVDVSPDGRTLVFDLLGDLWTLPIGGGDATLIAGGGAWEWQPRFSPDGARIAFISDRGGADNVWTCAPDGSDRRQVTKEDFRLVHCPEWMPDGDWILVRKHFTHTRSLGAGEIWMYHASGSGGAGVQLTEKSSNTADVNEPAISRDGRWLWFSHAGDFDYNRNVYAGIYAVSRIDRRTGQRESFSDGSGSACRPRPSPDGKSVAMVRRAGLKTALFVRELEDGREELLFDGLDHDTMETWSTNGAFPGYCWLPDSSAIVVTAGGKLVRIATRADAAGGVARGSVTPIPFRAKTTHQVHEALRFPRKAHDETVAARMIRWAQLSPDGGAVWFQALGQVWRQARSGGAAVAVTPPPEPGGHGELAYAPALSPDGKSYAYTTFRNGVGGALWLAGADGAAAPVKLFAQPGVIANPAFAPDGRRIAFVHGSDALVRGRSLAGDALRLAWIAADGSDAGRAHDLGPTTNRGSNRRMPRPFFAPAGGELLWFEDGGAGTVLVRARLDDPDNGGPSRLVLATNEDAEEIVPSPDLAWIAWKEQHQVYVAPFPQAVGRTLTIGRSGAPMPVKKLTSIGGSWLGWSADSKRLTWALGPEFVIQEVAPLFAAAPAGEAAAKPAEFTAAGVRPDAEVVALDASVPGDAPEGGFALVGARIVTMQGDLVIEDGTIVVERNRIAAVGPRSEVALPAGLPVVDGRGRTVMPGLIDVHAHLHYNALDIQPAQPWEYLVNLAYGVTATHDPSASTELVFAQSELVKAGRMAGPRVWSTGYILYGAKSANKAEVDSYDDAKRHLQRLHAVGAFSVKSYNQPRRNQRQWIVKAARELGMLVVPEGGSLLAQNVTFCLDGHTGLEHNLPVAPVYRDVVTLFANSGTGITPTLVVSYGGLNGEYWWYQRDRVFEKEPLRSLTPPGLLEAVARRRDVFAFDDDFQHVKVAEACAKILRAGGHLQLGAHGQLQGLGAHWELWMLGQGGLTPLEAIRCATHYGAWYLGMDGELGSLERGKLADFIVLAKNPLADLQNSDSVLLTCANGRLFDARTLEQQLPAARARPPFTWEAQ